MRRATNMHSKYASSWLVAVLSLCVAGDAWAQDRSPKPTKLQLDLYKRAFQAYKLNKFDQAITFLEAANSIQSFDLLHYSAGRAHFKRGRCTEAKQSYEAAASAPAFEPKKEPIDERVTMALAELQSQCPGEVLTQCAYPGTEIEIGDRPVINCGDSVVLPSGSYEVRFRLGSKEEFKRVDVKAMEESLLTSNLEPDPDVLVKEIEVRSTPWLPPTLMAAGGAGLVASLAVDVAWLGPSQAQFETLRQRRVPVEELSELKGRIDATRFTLIGTYAVSIGLLGAGATMLLLGQETPDESGESALGIAPGGVTWTYVW